MQAWSLPALPPDTPSLQGPRIGQLLAHSVQGLGRADKVAHFVWGEMAHVVRFSHTKSFPGSDFGTGEPLHAGSKLN